MRGCLGFIVGIALGAVALAVAQVFILRPAPLPAPTATNPDVVILLENNLMSRALQDQLNQSRLDVPLQGLTVLSQPPADLILSGTFVVAGGALKVPARIVLRAAVVGNNVAVEVIQAQAGTLKLPGSLFETLAAPLNRQLSQDFGQESYRIVGLSTTTDGLVVDVTIGR